MTHTPESATCSLGWIEGDFPRARLLGTPAALRDLAAALRASDDVVTIELRDGSGYVRRRWTDDITPAGIRGAWLLEDGPTLVIEIRRDELATFQQKIRDFADRAANTERQSVYPQLRFGMSGPAARRSACKVDVQINATPASATS